MNRTFFKSIILSGLFFALALGGFAQGVFFDPEPTDVTNPGRLFIDITSAECSCPELQDVDPVTNPLYIWLWNPNEPLMSPLNGTWGNSSDTMKMQQDPVNPNLWFFDFFGKSPAVFYQQPAAIFYSSGMDFLVKEKNGAPAGEAEQKSPDLNYTFSPVGCFEKICPFPTVFFQDEYFVITYDNLKETVPSLQNLGPDECLIWYRYSVNDGALQLYQEATDKFKMDYDGNGVFSKTMIPEEYFNISPGALITRIDVYITKAPIQAPPFTLPISLYPGCE